MKNLTTKFTKYRIRIEHKENMPLSPLRKTSCTLWLIITIE